MDKDTKNNKTVQIAVQASDKQVQGIVAFLRVRKIPYYVLPSPDKEIMHAWLASTLLRTELRGVVARGWCSDKNKNKEMDIDLGEAIVEELLKWRAE